MLKIFNFITNILAWLTINIAKIVGIVEALAKVVTGIISFAPTKTQDKLTPTIDLLFSYIKKALYALSEYLEKKGK